MMYIRHASDVHVCIYMLLYMHSRMTRNIRNMHVSAINSSACLTLQCSHLHIIYSMHAHRIYAYGRAERQHVRLVQEIHVHVFHMHVSTAVMTIDQQKRDNWNTNPYWEFFVPANHICSWRNGCLDHDFW